ncbi:RNA polymerase sigma-54 factor [Spirochaeta thermophila DSM 6192]|uniref:RNA polymerase sigma-54 factor n=1 Tax=Winmispira thermophila (strain ATCC 49972 / DSM 6192 / RI 19.B1) TaxID=665571 RepID=E0RRL8_WINT6|nr:RNA polymerase sigma-54 factor [Spirochaeta thermophila DSM 6192]
MKKGGTLQTQKPILSQTQKLKLAPQMIQSIQLLHLPLADLKLKIQEEVEKNPALEILEERGTISLDTAQEPPEVYEYFENTSDPGFSYARGSDDEDAKRRFLEGAVARGESLHEHLLWQLRLHPGLTAEEIRLGELLIQNLDDHGFHREDPFIFAQNERERHLIEKLIPLIQSFDPPGTCVKDSVESLLVQARQREDAPPHTEEVISRYLPLLEKGKTKEIAKALGMEEEDVLSVVEFIKTLTPFPGSLYSSSRPHYVIPDLEVKVKDGHLVIVLNEEEIPVLGVNPFFREMQKESDKKDVQRFVKQQVREAQMFIQSIHHRNHTLLRVARAIVEFQRDFFIRGPQYLVPLTLKDVAETVELHEATVSRITTNKYVQTEWGIYELKYFFTNSVSGAGSGGSRYSKEAVKHIIKEIIEEETKKTGRPLSDKKLAELLNKRGIPIARRTVAKYRKELNIRSSFERNTWRRLHEN